MSVISLQCLELLESVKYKKKDVQTRTLSPSGHSKLLNLKKYSHKCINCFVMPFSSTTMRKPGNIRKSKIHKHCRRPFFYKPKIYFSTRMIEIQNDMSERAIELLALPDDQPCFVLDIGCGSGLSGECLDEQGHYWIGIDISISMLSKQQIYLSFFYFLDALLFDRYC